MLKQQKVQLNSLCAWNLIHEYQDPFRDCYFTQLKVDIRPLGAFQRTTYTDGGLTHAAAAALLISSICPHLCTMHTPSDAMGMYAWGEALPRCTRANSQLCRHTTYTRGIFPACLFLPRKLFSPVWGTKPVVERFSKSALLRRRKRYFNSAVNKFCPFTCVRNTLNKLRFQDLAPRHQPNKSRLTAPGERRGSRGKHTLHKIKSLPEPWGQNGLVFFFEERGFYITFNLFSNTLSALESWVCINRRESVPHMVFVAVRMGWFCFFNYRSNKSKKDEGTMGCCWCQVEMCPLGIRYYLESEICCSSF